MEWYSFLLQGNKAIYSNMDGPTDYYTKWSKSERDKYHMISPMWNLKKQYKWTYLQNRNRLTDIENKPMATKGEQGAKRNKWDVAICSNMDGPRDCHSNWSQSDRERQISYITYIESLKNVQMNLFTKQK